MRKGWKTFPTFPTFPNAIIFNGIGRGMLRTNIPLRPQTFPSLSFREVGKTFPTFPFDGELPPLGLVRDAKQPKPDLGAGDVEHPVTHLSERLAEADALGFLISGSKR